MWKDYKIRVPEGKQTKKVAINCEDQLVPSSAFDFQTVCGRTWSTGVRKVLNPPSFIGRGHGASPCTPVRLLQTLSSIQSNSRRPLLYSLPEYLPRSTFSAINCTACYSTKVEVLSTKVTCPICLEGMKNNGTIFTGECSHSCHSTCISNTGIRRCPICYTKWNNPPSSSSSSSPPPSHKLTLKTFTECPAIAASDSKSSFSVLLSMQAPPLPVDSENRRVPVDLVAVLDVSGSMTGSKLTLLKSAANFVIDHMLPSDRLSMVAFSSAPETILPLCKMTAEGRLDAEMAVESLEADGSTNIVEGLNTGAEILQGRHKHERNPVSSIIFLSDGQDTDNPDVFRRLRVYHPLRRRVALPQYLKLLSPTIFPSNNKKGNETDECNSFLIHTFGLGEDHDPVAMNAIADASGGTFSFVESAKMIPTSFARCIGGIFSVVAQNVKVVVSSVSPGVKIEEIPSGRHKSEIESGGKQGMIDVGELYAEEKKDFLVQLSVPAEHLDEQEEEGKTPLLCISTSYHDPISEKTVQLEGEKIEIRRPKTLTPSDSILSVEVDRQKNRLAVAEAIAKAKELAEIDDFKGAKEMLNKCRAGLLKSESSRAGDDLVKMLDSELEEITARMGSRDMYERCGRAYTYSSMGSHGFQRAASRMSRCKDGKIVDVDEGDFFMAGDSYGTPLMNEYGSKAKKATNT